MPACVYFATTAIISTRLKSSSCGRASALGQKRTVTNDGYRPKATEKIATILDHDQDRTTPKALKGSKGVCWSAAPCVARRSRRTGLPVGPEVSTMKHDGMAVVVAIASIVVASPASAQMSHPYFEYTGGNLSRDCGLRGRFYPAGRT